MEILVTSFLSVPFFTSFWSADYVTTRFSFLVFFSIFLLTLHIGKRSIPTAFFVGYLLCSYAYISFYPNMYYSGNKINFLMLAKSLQSMVTVIASIGFASLLSNKRIEKTFYAVGYLMPLAIGFQIYSLHYNNSSVSMTTFSLAIALSYPFMSSKLNFINFLLFSICFWKYQAIMGFASLVVGFLLFRREKKSLLIIPAMVGILVYDPTIFSFSGREELWPLCLAVWNDIGNFIFGTGGGTFQHFVPLYQHLNGLLFRGTYLRWAHNDFLQILFEQGVVGLSLCVGFFVSMFFRIEKKYWLFMIVLILNMLGNFPLWIASDMLMTALFFKYHLWKEEKCLS